MNSSLSHQQSEDHKRKKRPRSLQTQDPEPPAFFDATATVSSTQFGACRLPELKALLWKSSVVAGTTKTCSTTQLLGTVQPRAFASGGRKTSNRHLRRRATSHKPWKRVRRITTPPGSPAATATTGEVTSSKSRKVRRQLVHSLQKQHEAWRWSPSKDETTTSSEQPLIHNNDNNNKTSIHSTATNWMTTHVWHAKRFRMQVLWSSLMRWNVPMLHSGRGCDAAVR